MGKLNNIASGRASGERWEEGKGGGFSSLFSLPSIPHALPFFPLPSLRTTSLRSISLRPKQHERGLCRGESKSLVLAQTPDRN